jgi:hypothetical protein
MRKRLERRGRCLTQKSSAITLVVNLKNSSSACLCTKFPAAYLIDTLLNRNSFGAGTTAAVAGA